MIKGEDVDDHEKHRRRCLKATVQGMNKKDLAARAGVERKTVYNFIDNPERAEQSTVNALHKAVSNVRFKAVQQRERERLAEWLRWTADRVERGELPGYSESGGDPPPKTQMGDPDDATGEAAS